MIAEVTAPRSDPTHHNHGGNIQVVTVPGGWPIWTSDVRPGREHDTTAVRTHPEILPAFQEISDDLWTLGDLGYEGEADTITVAFKKPKNADLTDTQQMANKAHNGIRAVGERGNALLKMTFRALRNVSVDPWRIGKDRRRGHRAAPHRTRPYHLTPLAKPDTTNQHNHADDAQRRTAPTVLPAPAPTTAPPTRTRSPKRPGAIPPPDEPPTRSPQAYPHRPKTTSVTQFTPQIRSHRVIPTLRGMAQCALDNRRRLIDSLKRWSIYRLLTLDRHAPLREDALQGRFDIA
jgi:hypothetical protein